MTMPRAALLAAIAMALQALSALIATAPLVGVLLSGGSVGGPGVFLIPVQVLLFVIWSIFFLAIYREQSGTLLQFPSRRSASILSLVLVTEYLAARISTTIFYTSWWAELRSFSGVLLVGAWLAFLTNYAGGPERPRVRTIAEILAVIVAALGLYQSYPTLAVWARVLAPAPKDPIQAFTGGNQLQWIYHPIATAWQVVIRPGVPILVWISETVFLWHFSKAPLNPPDSSQTPTAPA